MRALQDHWALTQTKPSSRSVLHRLQALVFPLAQPIQVPNSLLVQRQESKASPWKHNSELCGWSEGATELKLMQWLPHLSPEGHAECSLMWILPSSLPLLEAGRPVPFQRHCCLPGLFLLQVMKALSETNMLKLFLIGQENVKSQEEVGHGYGILLW